jgi:hypothetical protein
MGQPEIIVGGLELASPATGRATQYGIDQPGGRPEPQALDEVNGPVSREGGRQLETHHLHEPEAEGHSHLRVE